MNSGHSVLQTSCFSGKVNKLCVEQAFLSGKCISTLPSTHELTSSSMEQIWLVYNQMLCCFHAVCQKGMWVKISNAEKLFNSSHRPAQPLFSPAVWTQHLQIQQAHNNPWHCFCKERRQHRVHTPAQIIQQLPCCKFYSFDHFRSNLDILLPEWRYLLHVWEINKYCRVIAAN